MVDLSKLSDQAIFNEFSRRYKSATDPKKNIVLLGPPGSGKGTQAPRIAKEYSLCHVGMGDLLRAELNSESKLGQKIKSTMEKGYLVDAEDVVELIKNKMSDPECKKGMILDGVPRNMEQAKKLDEMFAQYGTKISRAFELQVPDDGVLVERIEGRRIHPSSGRIYHTKHNPPKKEGKDDVTDENLIKRKDDNRGALNKRLETYTRFTIPVLEYYNKRGILSIVDASQKIDDIWNDIKKQLS